jgi:hypothetical protein
MSLEGIDHYLNELHSGDRKNAWFSLAEMGSDVVPRLVSEFRSESDLEMKTALVDVIGEMRLPESIPFLQARASLHDIRRLRCPSTALRVAAPEASG